MSDYYDPDDVLPHSPGLEPVKPKARPSPSPPPVITSRAVIFPAAQSVSPPPSKKRKRLNRAKTRPSQGDVVLLNFMAPDRPDLARQAGERTLGGESGPESDDDEMESEEPQKPATVQADPGVLQRVALQGLQVDAALPTPAKDPINAHRDSVVEAQLECQPPKKTNLNTPNHTSDSSRTNSNGVDPKSPIESSTKEDATSPTRARECTGSIANGYPHDDSVATSPNLRELTIPQSRGPPGEKLPALQSTTSPRDGPAGSPNQERMLPPFRAISEMAESVINEHNETRANSYPHRLSVSSTGTGQSPTMVSRTYSISSQRSPATGFAPFSATSPISASSEFSTNKDPFLSSGQHGLFGNSTRRPSQASETTSPFSNGPPSALPSGQTTDGYQSSDTLSPGSQHSPIETRTQRMSLDGAMMATRTLPLPTGPHIQHIPPHGSGGFKCDHPGCTAPPFQTQYLLNSHANVHSQSRPHYCPVPGCPRGENGKGFKRKNEMIRHGLVHQSPGYVCPFCPDREHKYPRPDNLQRHVRVHHGDKKKDDPLLRDVLSQRPEGGTRGRRRRAGS